MKKSQHYFFLLTLPVIIITIGLTSLVLICQFVVFEFIPFDGSRITGTGLKIEIFLVTVVGWFLLGFFGRPWLAMWITGFLYAVFLLVSFQKIAILNSTLLIQDFKYADQLLMLWPVFKPHLLSVLLLIGLLVFVTYLIIKFENKVRRTQKGLIFQWLMLIALMMVFLFPLGVKNDIEMLSSNKKSRSHMVATSEKYGLLTTFFRNALNSKVVEKPPGYSESAVLQTIAFPFEKKPKGSINEPKVNVIIYLVESFTDPWALGIKTSKDPIPFFRGLMESFATGFVYSPELGGRSANAEFELLTGFTKHFFSHSSIPFIDLPFQPIPGLAHEFRNAGYRTQVIQASSLRYFNYQQAYQMLGFEHINSIAEDERTIMDAANRFPSDISVVDNIIEASQKDQPFFIYAFTNATHGSWNYDAFDGSDLDLVLEERLNSPKGERQLRTYINALHEADKSIKKLIQHFENHEDKTIILILGDHQPGLPELRESFMLKTFPQMFKKTKRKRLEKQFIRFDQNHPLASYEIMHKVPYLLWSNFELNDQHFGDVGMTEIPNLLFEWAEMMPEMEWFLYLRELYVNINYIDVIKYVYLGGKNLDANAMKWIKAYELIQYDLLSGDGYLKKMLGVEGFGQ